MLAFTIMAQALSERLPSQRFCGPYLGQDHRGRSSYRRGLHKQGYACGVFLGLWVALILAPRHSPGSRSGCIADLLCGGSTVSEALRVARHGIEDQEFPLHLSRPGVRSQNVHQSMPVGFHAYPYEGASSGEDAYDFEGWRDEEVVEKRLMDDLGVGPDHADTDLLTRVSPDIRAAPAVPSFFEEGTHYSDAQRTVFPAASENAAPGSADRSTLQLEQLERLVQQLRVVGEPADQRITITFEPNPATDMIPSSGLKARDVTALQAARQAPPKRAAHGVAEEWRTMSMAQLKGQTLGHPPVTGGDSNNGSSEDTDDDSTGETSVSREAAPQSTEVQDTPDFPEDSAEPEQTQDAMRLGQGTTELQPPEEPGSPGGGKLTAKDVTPDVDQSAANPEKGADSDRTDEEESSEHAQGPGSPTSPAAPGSRRATGDATQAQQSVRGNEPASQAKGVTEAQSKAAANFSAKVLERLRGSSDGMASVLQVVEHGRLLNERSLVTIAYHFSFRTRESRKIAFIIVALPPGYTAPAQGPLCESVDPDMPPLSCQVRFVSSSKATKDTTAKAQPKNVFIQVSSADKSRSLPLGMHHFGIAVHTPAHPIAVNVPSNWWFVTFRFTGGHAVTKHFENRLLTARQKCSWSEWRQETPCSATCGEGLEVWTRTLFAGESEKVCGGAILKRRCFRAPCSVNCQLGPWQTIVDCTRSCDADNRQGFKISMRKVLMDKTGWGAACKRQYSWNPEAKEGWSEKLEAVIRLEPCEAKFAGSCPADIGCRAEKINSRTLSVSYPWGSCPFPCGGLGSITSIVQVANGIPRWIGERDFPESFQAPCRADKEPLVTRTPCNTFDCEDCSVYLENAKHGNESRAWIFFLPSQDANIIKITAPRGVSFNLTTPPSAYNKSAPSSTNSQDESHAVATKRVEDLEAEKEAAIAKGLLPRAEHPTDEELLVGLAGRPDKKQQLAELTKKIDGETGKVQEERKKSFQKLFEENACALMPTSFGYVSACSIGQSERYPGSEEATLRLAELIAPRADDALNKKIYPHLQEVTVPSETEGEGGKHRRRPEWLAVPVTLGEASAMEDPGNFYVWLMSSWSPRDPEVFKCHLKTKLAVPRSCRFEYSAVDPKDCTDCRVDAPKNIMTLRTFVHAKHGGTCSIPIEQQITRPVLVYAACAKGCGRILHDGTPMSFAKENEGGLTIPAEGEKVQSSSRLRNVSQTGLKHLLEKTGGPHVVAEPAAPESGGRYSVDLQQVADYEDVVQASTKFPKGHAAKGGKETGAKELTAGPKAASVAGQTDAAPSTTPEKRASQPEHTTGESPTETSRREAAAEDVLASDTIDSAFNGHSSRSENSELETTSHTKVPT